MESRTQADDFARTLAEEALSRPESEREAYLRAVCGSNAEMFAEAWSYVRWEKRMQGFLLDTMRPLVPTRPPFEPGQLLINRFRVIREVAQGGMGIVWQALDQKLERSVALKCAKAGFGKQLPPEVRNAREISHPNVCKTFEIHTASTADGEVDFISMEFLEGETLAERIHRAPLGDHEGMAVAQQLCSGLAEAHRNRLIHGDLKANNIILTRDSHGSMRAVITDFGLARTTDSSGAVLGGTPAYMAPELWSGDNPSVASDLYALGVLLWEIRAGCFISSLGVPSSTLSISERVHWKRPSGRGRRERTIARCLDPDPARRFASAGEVALALRGSRRRQWLLATAATLVFAVGFGATMYQRAQDPPETVRFALLPFASAPGDASVSEHLLRNTATQLDQLKNTPHTRFRFIPLDKVIRNRVNTPEEARVLLGASHSLHATVERRGDALMIHAYLTSLQSGLDAQEWTEEYKRGEIRYAPVALAALITEILHLHPPTGGASVNAAARKDYLTGLMAVRRDKTLNEALGRFERARKADPDSVPAFAGLAEAQWYKYALTNDKAWLERTAESVRQAQLRNPDLAEVHRVAGLLKSHEGHYEQAEAEYLRAIELDPNSGDAYRRLGEAYERGEQNEEALAAFRKAIEVDPQQYRNYRDLGDFYFQRARYKEAVMLFRTALKIAPGELLVSRHLGQAYMNEGQLTLAEAELRGLIAKKELPSAIHTLGLVLMYQSRDREAIPMFLRALHLGAERCEWWMNLGIAYRRVGRFADFNQASHRGIDLAERELTNNPRASLTRAYVSYLSAELGDRRRAVLEIAQALQAAPNDADVRWMAAITYEALGRRSDTLSVLSNSPPAVLADLNRWPDMADLHKDSRFIQLLDSHSK